MHLLQLPLEIHLIKEQFCFVYNLTRTKKKKKTSEEKNNKIIETSKADWQVIMDFRRPEKTDF